MAIQKTIKKLITLSGIFFSATGSIIGNNNFVIVGIVLTIISEVLFLLK